MITQEKIDKLFTILRIVHTSHWKPPKAEDVNKEIEKTGAYIFRAGKEQWVAEVKLTETSITYEINPELPARMKKKAEEMKKKFEQLIRGLL